MRKVYEPGPVINVDGADYTLRAIHCSSFIRMAASGYKTVVIQPEDVEGLPDSGEWTICNAAAEDDGAIGIIAQDGVTLRRGYCYSHQTFAVMPGQQVTLKRTARNEFFVSGDTGRPIVADSNADHDIAASEAWAFLRMAATGAKTVTFRPESTEALPNYADLMIVNAGASGDLTLVAGAGVTLTPPEGGTLVLEPDSITDGARGLVTVTRVSADVFNVTGDTVPAA